MCTCTLESCANVLHTVHAHVQKGLLGEMVLSLKEGGREGGREEGRVEDGGTGGVKQWY